jgi:hypothetical protein
VANKTEICNMALSNIQVSQFIDGNVETDTTIEAKVCKRWYDHAVNYALEDFDWNFARRRRALAALGTTPPSTWTYVYSYPSDCAAARAIEVPGVRTPSREQRIAYEVAAEAQASGGDVRVIYTDQPDAVLIFTKRITDASLFDGHFVEALAAYLASKIALPLTAKPGLAREWFQMYQGLRVNSFAFHLNEAQEDQEPPSETEQARNG